jgi:hypothetical protein
MIDSLINNDVVFYSIFIGIAGTLSYSFVSSTLNSVYQDKVEKGIQTDV